MVVSTAKRPKNRGAAGRYLLGHKSDRSTTHYSAPDIYFREHKIVTQVIDLYRHSDNALYILRQAPCAESKTGYV